MATAIKSIVKPAPAEIIAAADIGYGSTKAIACVNGVPGDHLWMPSGAAPASRVNATFTGEKELPLDVQGTPYYAGFEPDESRHERHDGEQFAKSPDYHALFLETLERLGHSHISTMVLGLPSREFESGVKAYLKETFAGTFTIRGKEYTVDNVLVADQPVGTAAAYYQEHTDALANRRLLVIDIGYGTTDVALIVRGAIDRDFSMSLDVAMRTVCEGTARAISNAHDFDVRASQIDETLRMGQTSYTKWGTEVDIMTFAQAPLETAAESIMAGIMGRFGSLAQIDQILVTGGGSVKLGDMLGTRAKGVPTATMKSPVTANLDGFILMATSRG